MSRPLLSDERLTTATLTEREFASLAAEGREIIGSLVRAKVFPPGVELFTQGSPPSEVFFVDRGLVKLVHVYKQGREQIIGLRGSGWPLGGAAAVIQQTLPVSATTVTRCDVSRISSQKFLHLLAENARFSLYIHQAHSREIWDQVNRIIGLGSSSARQRLEQLLEQLIAAQELRGVDGQIRLQLPLKHWEIAQLIAVTPQHLCEIWKQMESDGLIRRHKGWLILPTPQRL